MNPIDALFGRLRSEGRKAFIPFLTAGDPDLAGTVPLVARAAAAAGPACSRSASPTATPSPTAP